MIPASPEPEWAPWCDLPVHLRRLSVAEVRTRCARLDGARTATRRYGFGSVDVKPSAAMIPVLDVDGEAGLLVTKRPPTMEYHRNDWVFPGGRVDAGADLSPAATAVRELHEELGVDPQWVDTVGHLATYGPFVTGFLLHVFVGLVSPSAIVAPDPSEVAEVALLKLSDLTEPGTYFTGLLPAAHDPGPPSRSLDNDRARTRDLKFFRVGDEDQMWGTQGEILWDLLSLLFNQGEDGSP